MIKKLLGSCAVAALVPTAIMAQSTGSVDFEEKTIVVTGSRGQGIAGVVEPVTSKAKSVLNSTFIQKQTPGQSINDIINMMPGVSFQNNDATGASGGTLTIHGFDASRISQTVDGVPLNDTGNYAIYSNQQVDPELIDQVNVNLGTTDVDSPTAAATGSTVNYRTRVPFDKLSARVEGSGGSNGLFRVFGVIDTGIIGPIGTKAYFSASKSSIHNPYNYNSQTNKMQLNAKVYQPIGSDGDFVSVAGNWNVSRNGNFSSVPLRIDTVQSPTNSAVRVVGSGSANRFPITNDERDYSATQPACNTDIPQTGVADVPNTCGTFYDQSFNPSNTGNIRISSKFSVTDKLTLTVDPSYQYVKANGGTGAVKGNEGFYGKAGLTTPIYGYIGGQPYFGGVDLNGDGDILDTSTRNATTGVLSNTTQGVEVYSSSQTGTHRIGVLASLRYDISDDHTIRVSYSYDHGKHRQTGMIALLKPNGYTSEYFPIDNPVLGPNGQPIQKRNRLSYAILNQISGEYVGKFLDEKLVVNIGGRLPFFQRKLNNMCVTEAGGSFVDCFTDAASQAAFLAANPTYVAPTKKNFSFNKFLPTGGIVYNITNAINVFASYNKGYQVPGTDNLYQSLGFSGDTAQPKPETTDNFEGGIRYTTSTLQAQLSGWYTKFHNRLASAYDPINDVSIYRNLGTVQKGGVDGSIAYKPEQHVTLYAFGSYLKSHIDENIELGRCTTLVGTCTSLTQIIYAQTKGKRESGSPVYTAGGRIEGTYGPITAGIQAKRTGRRYVNDQNLPVTLCTASFVNVNSCPGVAYGVYGNATPGYTLVDLDVRFSLAALGMNDKSYFQFNVTNLFDKLYVSGFSGTLAATTTSFSYVGPPRQLTGTLNIAF